MTKPRIGITGNILTMETGIFPGLNRAYVNNDYVGSIERANAIPVILPVLSNLENVKSLIEGLDGILLSGGYDVDPDLYGEGVLPECGFIVRKVDDFCIEILHAANINKIPVFGICKGLQIINVAFGGTLYQDLNPQMGGFLKHSQMAPRFEPTHDIVIAKNSFLGKVIGESARVNSFHHQCVKNIANGFIATAEAIDGTIEAIERQEGSFISAVQFHPEMMAEFGNPEMENLFQSFVNICAK